MYITTDLLTRRRACRDQLNLFTSLFPDGVTITQALCIEHADKFDWRWAAQNLLSEPLYAEYNAKCEPLDAKYIVKRAPLVAEYNAKCALLFGGLAENSRTLP